MDKIVFIMINIMDFNEITIMMIQRVIHIKTRLYLQSGRTQNLSTTGLMDPGFITILSFKWILFVGLVGNSASCFRIKHCPQIHCINSFRENFYSVLLCS